MRLLVLFDVDGMLFRTPRSRRHDRLADPRPEPRTRALGEAASRLLAWAG
jgi:hypothetical protein